MSNPLFNMLGGGAVPPQMRGAMDMVRRFREFQQNFRGDPRQKVQELLNSGRVTQEQYNQAVKMAQQIQNMMK